MHGKACLIPILTKHYSNDKNRHSRSRDLEQHIKDCVVYTSFSRRSAVHSVLLDLDLGHTEWYIEWPHFRLISKSNSFVNIQILHDFFKLKTLLWWALLRCLRCMIFANRTVGKTVHHIMLSFMPTISPCNKIA